MVFYKPKVQKNSEISLQLKSDTGQRLERRAVSLKLQASGTSLCNTDDVKNDAR